MQVADLQRLLALVAELLDEVEVVDHVLVAAAALLVLVLEDAAGGAAVAGEEQEQVVLEVVERLGVELERVGLDVAVGQELEAGQPAVGGDVLVLLADRLLEQVDLDVARLLGQSRGWTRFFL